ncbi:MAG: DUF6895 family protein [Blastocatellia bacterium]
MKFIFRAAGRRRNFEDYGSTLLYFLGFVASTAQDADLRRMAREKGEVCFGWWRRRRGHLPADAGAETIADFVHGYGAAERLGFRSQRLKTQLRQAAAACPVEDYLWFDPLVEPPPEDIPEPCVCGTPGARGHKTCRNRQCRKRLRLMSRYKVWYTALTAAFCGEQYEVPLGARYKDVLRWLPAMRPYRGWEGGRNPDFYDSVYAVTHVVYTLNDYGVYLLSPRWLPDEFAFLKSNLPVAMALDDPDMAGEFMDALLAFGLTDGHPLMRAGIDYLLSKQNPDGSWGDLNVAEVAYRFHPTWTAIDGLRDYAWRGVGLKFPELKPRLRRWARENKHDRAATGA